MEKSFVVTFTNTPLTKHSKTNYYSFWNADDAIEDGKIKSICQKGSWTSYDRDTPMYEVQVREYNLPVPVAVESEVINDN